MAVEKILVPDIGGSEADVIEILVKPGDQVQAEAPLITMEGEKATMDVPSPFTGVVKSVDVKVGDKLAEGKQIATIETDAAAPSKATAEKTSTPATAAPQSAAAASSEQTIQVPDLGDDGKVEVIEVSVKVGDQINQEDPIMTLEGEKATMDVPSPFTGKITALSVKVGDKVASGDAIGKMQTDQAAPAPAKSVTESSRATQTAASTKAPAAAVSTVADDQFAFGTDIHAGPAVRRIAREFGVNLRKVFPTGLKSRITKEDVQQYVKQQLQLAERGSAPGFNLPAAPKVDFKKYGEISTQPLSKIKKISGANLHRNWVSIPHVTQFDEADITEMEAFRQEQKAIAAAQGIKLTPLVFIMKAVVAALKQFPLFNASLDDSGEHLIIKQYYHIGVAVDTPNGLVVPVIRDVDKKGLYELAKELGDISKKAREKGLSLTEMQGGCFTISSLGGIGGTAFTPIINAPEVAILGVSKSARKPTYLAGQDEFVPRLMLPLSLSYDHRVVDGADGARFISFLSSRLADLRTILL